MSIQPKIYLMGASGVGKTTLAKWIAERFGLPLLTNVVGRSLAECELTFDQVLRDPQSANELQFAIWSNQLEEEEPYWQSASSGFVSDRSLDIFAYTSELARNAWKLQRGESFKKHLLRIEEAQAEQRCLIFFVRPHPDVKAQQDGRRDWLIRPEVVHRVDGAIQWILESNRLDYIPINCGFLRDRQALVEAVTKLTIRR